MTNVPVLAKDLMNNVDIPEKGKILKSFLDVFNTVNTSDDSLADRIFSVIEKEIEVTKPTDEFNNLSKLILNQYEELLKEDISVEDKKQVLESEKEIYMLLADLEKQRFLRLKEISEDALEKETEKAENKWSFLKFMGFTAMAMSSALSLAKEKYFKH